MSEIIVDAHLDMAYNAVVLGRDLTQPVAEIRAAERDAPSVYREEAGTCLVSVPALLAGRVAVAGGSIFVDKTSQHYPTGYHTSAEAHQRAVKQLDYYRRLADEDARVSLVTSEDVLDDVLATWETNDPRLGILIVMEGADPIQEPKELSWWVERGLRGVGPTWSLGSQYAGGNAAPGGFTDAGRELLDAMAEYNLLLDLSHLWEDAVYEALDRYPGPIVATHANPRVFVDSPRLLSDDVIRRIAQREGVVGVIPFNVMLKAGWRRNDPRLPLSSVVAAMDHVCQVVGHARAVGIGSDFDGGFGREAVPVGLESAADLPNIGAALKERGFDAADVRAILGENWLRVMRRTLKPYARG
ncbi:MAG: dipeptidase [Anaerolineales bacterium]